MAYYVVEMDLCMQTWHEAKCIVNGASIEEALEKAKLGDFLDMKLGDQYDSCVVDYDKGEGISITNAIGGIDVYRETE